MNRILYVIDYPSTNKESQKLIRMKSLNEVLELENSYIIHIKTKEIMKLLITALKSEYLILDSPYSPINIVLMLIYATKRQFGLMSYILMSARGNLPVKGVKNYSKKYIYWLILAKLLDYCSGIVIASSKYEKNELSTNILQLKNKIRVIPDIIYCKEYFKGITKHEKTRSKKKDNVIRILCPSRDSDEKGVNELIDIVNNRVDENYEYTFCINRREVDKDSIKYLGWMCQDEFNQAIEDCDIVIIPSIYESFSIAAYQALMKGKGVIITNRSPWMKISNIFANIPILCCEPLLKNTTYSTLCEMISEVNHKKKMWNQTNRKIELERAIKNEAYY